MDSNGIPLRIQNEDVNNHWGGQDKVERPSEESYTIQSRKRVNTGAQRACMLQYKNNSEAFVTRQPTKMK
jgi:hypothetical protein